MLLHDHSQQQPFLGLQQDKNRCPSFVNMASSYRTSVLLSLSDSSLMWVVHTCYCRESADPSDQFDRVLAADIWKVVSGVYDTPKSKLKCKACQVPFNSHHHPFVAPLTWFVHFPISDGQNTSPFRLRDLPVLIVLLELRTGREISFELGFFGYGTMGSPRNPLSHATSVHWINQQYFTYDGM